MTQSALDTAGRDAEQIAQLFSVMTVGAVVIWTAVVVIAVYAIRSRQSHSQRAADLIILGGGVALPTVVLGALLAYGLPILPAILTPAKRKWVRQVTTDSTHPPPRTFTGSAADIARKMARKDVSPKGIGSGIRMIQYFINRGGRNLSATRRAELERAKRILQRRAARPRAATKKR